MKDVLQKITRQEVMSMYTKPENDRMAEAMHEFLTWLEQNKGLTLCHAFKPQYDWYMPAFANKQKLAHEFLGNVRLGASRPLKTEHLNKEHLT
jgi:hypothetical protein